jgi:hypothetical protein
MGGICTFHPTPASMGGMGGRWVLLIVYVDENKMDTNSIHVSSVLDHPHYADALLIGR